MSRTPEPMELDDALAWFGSRPSERRSELVPLSQAMHRVLASPIVADRDLPPFDRATMDGIAVRFDDLPSNGILEVVRTVPAGGDPGPPVESGEAVAIATGAAVPEGLDTVIERERIDGLDESAPGRVEARLDGVRAGRSIHPRGTDARRGDRLADAATTVDATTIALAATTGKTAVSVVARPRVAIVTTGDELRDAADPLDGPGDANRLRDGNGPMLRSTLERLGAEVAWTKRVGDDLEATRRAIEEGVDAADLCITVGGVSAGALDLVPAAAAELGLEPVQRGVRVQPGRPLSWWSRNGRLGLVGLPGNPVSALVCAHLFVRPWIESTLGLDPASAWTPRILSSTVATNRHRPACRPSRFSIDATGRAIVEVATWSGSGDLPHLAGTHGIARMPSGVTEVAEGTIVPTLDW